jgi:DNA-binding Lrp family transcriptional regulator
MLTEKEKRAIASIQGDIPVTERPYHAMAEQAGIPVGEYLDILKGLSEKGVIRRFGATLRHQKSGFTANAMVAWNVPEEQAETVGTTMAGFAEVSHCYRRNPAKDWPYNLYTMIHGTSEEQVKATAERISTAVSITDYSVLFSRKELKKTSMTYFGDVL